MLDKNFFHKTLTLPCILLTLLALAAAPAALGEDLTVVSQVTTKKGKPTTTTQYISGAKVRTSDGRYDTIIDVASGHMIHIDHKKKFYQETTLQELTAHFAELQKMFDENPMLASVLGKMTEVQVEKGTGTRTIAGYTTRQYFMTMGESFRFEFYAAPDLEVPMHYHDAKKLAYAAMGPMATRFEKMYDAMKTIDGFPLWTKVDTQMIGINMEVVSEATEVRKGPIPAGTFEPPADYKKKKGAPFKK